MPEVYINKISKFLPNEPVSNEEMESKLGLINQTASKSKNIVLRSNKIKTRYYALDNQGNSTHTNAQLTRNAIEGLFDENFQEKDIEVLSCGTSTPDLLLPSHAAMVHGLFEEKSMELNSAAGICTSGMNALKYGFLSVKSENSKNAIVTGSEKVSTWLKSTNFEKEIEDLKQLEEAPIIAFKKDFLRWMLSDGAAAVLLENEPKGDVSLKIEWMNSYSYAHQIETCMYAGGEKEEDGSITPWSNYSAEERALQSIFSIKQDVKVLDKYILEKGVESCKEAISKNQLDPQSIDYFLPHISSYFFAEKLKDLMHKNGVNVKDESWFMNLKDVGNVGSASIFLTLEELLNSGKLKKGEKIFLSVPESGRFSYSYALLTVC